MMFRGQRIGAFFRGVAVGAVLAAGAARAEEAPLAADVGLTISPGWSAVHELRHVDLLEGRRWLVIEGIPAAAGMTSLRLSSRRFPLRLLEWRRVRPDMRRDSQGETGDVLIVRRGDRWVREGPGARSVPGGTNALRCLVESPVSGRRAISVDYVVTGLEWRVSYQLAIRGSWDSEKRMACDLWGTVHIRNRTGRTFRRARVRLVDPGRSLRRRKAPGYLILADESPLSDLWRNPRGGEAPGYVCRLGRRLDVVAGETTRSPLVAACRVPGRRIYEMDTRRFSLDPESDPRPLRRVLVFRNERAAHLGMDLPAGGVEIFLGSVRRRLFGYSRLPRTVVGDEIRVDLGDAPDVFGRRRAAAARDFGDGYSETVYEIFIRNRRGQPVRVRVDDFPGTVEWKITRCNCPFERRGARLHLEATVKPHRLRVLQYTLRIHSPPAVQSGGRGGGG